MKFEPDSNISSGGVPVEQALQLTIEAFRLGDFVRAEQEAERALALDFENATVLAALKCAVFWKDRVVRMGELLTAEAQADGWLKEWSGFHGRFIAHLDVPFLQGIEAIRQFVYQKAAQTYLAQIDYVDETERAQLLIKAAKAFKGNGDFDQAISALEAALELQKDDAQALAELADCNEMINQTATAKRLFREAFYLNPQQVDLSQLRSVLVQTVIESLKDSDLSPSELKEWIPVQAVIQGIFTVKRELKPLELGHLKQSINSLKAELQAGTGSRNILLPRLLNRYFWLIDHYLNVKEDRTKIEDILLNIRLLDPKIYELYTH